LIKNVIFDVGGVLLDWNPIELLEKMFDREKAVILKKNMMDTPYWAELDRGTLEIEEAVEIFSKDIPALKNDIRMALSSFIEYLPPISENVEILRKLYEKKYHLYVLSNFQLEAFDKALEKFDFFNYFNGMIVSARVKMIKPDREIYEHILREFDLIPEETVFFDDTIKNIETANETGIIGVHTPTSRELSDYYLNHLQ